jgi:hypothetical protein
VKFYLGLAFLSRIEHQTVQSIGVMT